MKRFFSILLSIVLMASHLGLASVTHFCGGEAVETKITVMGETHLGCSMPEMEETCESNTNAVHFDNVPCCENEYQTIKVTDEFVKDATQVYFNIDFAAAFIYTTINLRLFPKSTHRFYIEYKSPPLEKDIQMLFQTFLI